MSREEAIRLARSLGEAVNAHDTERLMALYADRAMMSSPMWNGVTGHAAIAKTWDTTFALFPDWQVGIGDVFVEGDRIALIGTASATDRNGWFGQAPTGERFEYRAIIVLTFSEGKIVRDERVYDLTSVLQRLEKARLDKELLMAAEVQRTLSSRSAHTTGYCEAVGDSIACRAIGGDFFELVPVSSTAFALALGDVSGKGPAPALLAAMIQGMLAVEMQIRTEPADILDSVNKLLVRKGFDARFATLCYALLSSDGALSYANAGHNPPLLLSGNSIRQLSAGGPILGVFHDAVFQRETVHLSEGDTLIMFSDGVTEAVDAQGQEFGDDRLIACIKAYQDRTAAEMLQAIMQSVQRFCAGNAQADDMTVTVARFQHSAV